MNYVMTSELKKTISALLECTHKAKGYDARKALTGILVDFAQVVDTGAIECRLVATEGVMILVVNVAAASFAWEAVGISPDLLVSGNVLTNASGVWKKMDEEYPDWIRVVPKYYPSTPADEPRFSFESMVRINSIMKKMRTKWDPDRKAARPAYWNNTTSMALFDVEGGYLGVMPTRIIDGFKQREPILDFDPTGISPLPAISYIEEVSNAD